MESLLIHSPSHIIRWDLVLIIVIITLLLNSSVINIHILWVITSAIIIWSSEIALILVDFSISATKKSLLDSLIVSIIYNMSITTSMCILIAWIVISVSIIVRRWGQLILVYLNRICKSSVLHCPPRIRNVCSSISCISSTYNSIWYSQVISILCVVIIVVISCL